MVAEINKEKVLYEIEKSILKRSSLYKKIRQRIREDMQDYELFLRMDDNREWEGGFRNSMDGMPYGGYFVEHLYQSLSNNFVLLKKLHDLGEDNALIRYTEKEWDKFRNDPENIILVD